MKISIVVLILLLGLTSCQSSSGSLSSAATGLSKGLQDGIAGRKQRRAEIREALERFKENNPEATEAELLWFINAHAGSSAYLRGVLSSEELQSIVAANAERRRKRLEEEAWTREQRKRERYRIIQEEADIIELYFDSQSEQEGADVEETKFQYLQNRFPYFNLDELGFKPATFFNESRRQVLRTSWLNDNMQYLKSIADSYLVHPDKIMEFMHTPALLHDDVFNFLVQYRNIWFESELGNLIAEADEMIEDGVNPVPIMEETYSYVMDILTFKNRKLFDDCIAFRKLKFSNKTLTTKDLSRKPSNCPY